MSNELTNVAEKLKSTDPAERECAVDRIGELNPPEAFDLIVPLLSDCDPEVRGTAACNLGRIRNQQAIVSLINTAEQDASGDVKAEALASLAEYQDSSLLSPMEKEKLLQCLLTLATVPDLPRRVRQQVAKQLGNFTNNKEAIATLTHFRQTDTDAFVRDFAEMSLQKTPDLRSAN